MTSSEKSAAAAWQADPIAHARREGAAFVGSAPSPQGRRGFSPLRVPATTILAATSTRQSTDRPPEATSSSSTADKLDVGVAPGETSDAPVQERRAVDERPAPGESELVDARLARARDEGQAEGYARGLADARRQAEAELAAWRRQVDADKAGAERLARLLEQLHAGLRALSSDPSRLHQPLKRLAVHLAEELVRGELRLSGEAVHRLVDHALQMLGPTHTRALVRLHPDDLAMLEALADDSLRERIRLEADSSLARGSVETESDGTVVQDLLENRLSGLAEQILDTRTVRARTAGGTTEPGQVRQDHA